MNEGRQDISEAPAVAGREEIRVRTARFDDLIEALGSGLKDFRRTPQFGLLFGFVYAAGGWIVLLCLWYFNLPYLAYPMAMGFALIAPFLVTGLYDVSRKLEQGEALGWRSVLGSVWETRRRDLRWMALVTAFAFVIWMDIAAILTFGFLGFKQLDAELVNEILTTPSGLLFLLIGNVTGALIAFGIYSISVISFPLLFDRDVDFVTGMVTSVKAVQKSPIIMAAWCVLIAILLLISIMSAFVALIVILPVLGHASWHLYRRLVDVGDVGSGT